MIRRINVVLLICVIIIINISSFSHDNSINICGSIYLFSSLLLLYVLDLDVKKLIKQFLLCDDILRW